MILHPHTGLPSSPGTPSYTVQQCGQDNAILTVHWDPPEYDGETPVNYTITISPGFSQNSTSGTSVTVPLSYNVIHTVSVLATNCIGNSNTSMETITLGILFSV